VIEAQSRKPPRNRFEWKQVVNARCGSTSVTSMAPFESLAMYFAAVAPPGPPPMTMTRGFACASAGRAKPPATTTAPVPARNRLRWMRVMLPP
jgi:hypothetical protein